MFNTQLESHTIDYLLSQLDNNNMDLNPQYQRGDVWKPKMRSDFIESVYKGIIPQNITLNKEFTGETTKLTCIDGKQRLTTLKMFQKNEVPLIIYLDDEKGNEIVKHIYYNKIPKKEDNIKYDTLKNMKQIMTHFLDRRIPVGYYSEITYAEQTDIFKRINNGSPATRGEIYSSNFKNEEAGELINNFFNNHNFLNDDRGQHVDYLIKFLQMVEYDKIRITSREEEKFVKKYDNLNRMKKIIKKCENFLKIYYSDKIIQNCKIKSLSLLKHFKIALSYMIYKSFVEYENNSTRIIKLIISISQIWDVKTNKDRKCSSDKSITNLQLLFNNNLKNLDKIKIKKLKSELIDSESNNSESDNSDYDNSDSDNSDSDNDNKYNTKNKNSSFSNYSNKYSSRYKK